MRRTAGETNAVVERYVNGNDTLLPTGAIKSVRIDGTLSSDSRVLAVTLADFVKLNGQKIATASNPPFKL